LREPSPVPLKAGLEQLPYHLGRWTGIPAGEGRSTWWPDADQQLRRSYRVDGAPDVDLYVGYFSWQRQGKETVSYRAADLHRMASVVSVPMPDGRSFAANLTRLADPPPARHALFWYEVDGTIEVGQLRTKLLTAWHAVTRGRTNGAVVMLAVRETGHAGSTQAPESLLELAGLVRVALEPCLPWDGASATIGGRWLAPDGSRSPAVAEQRAARMRPSK